MRGFSGKQFVTRAALALVAASTLAGCGNFVAGSGVYYNSGLSDASNAVLLTNIVRAAKGYPTYYSAVGEFSASQSLEGSLNANADFSGKEGPGTTLGVGDVGVSVGPNISVNRNANASSLETQDFIRAMHTRITPELFALLVESGSLVDMNLKLALLIESVSITRGEHDGVIAGAHRNCDPSSVYGRGHGSVCSAFAQAMASAQCAVADGTATVAGHAIVRLRNDPSDACEYDRFRTFIEAFMLNQPRLEQNEKGETVLRMGSEQGASRMFAAEGTGFLLRSPGGVVNYLGQMVRGTYRTGWTPELSTFDGHSVPIFLVNSSAARGRAAVVARVDGEQYWIARRSLGSARADFSNSVLALVKDLQALNTLHDQLPKSPSILIGR